jgi:tetratricopeptide (TPR) repeat protein
VRRRHRDFFLPVAEEETGKLRGPEEGQALRRLESEYDNLRGALEGCLAEAEDAEAALRLAGALPSFWVITGRASEGRSWLRQALERSPAPTALRAVALHGAAWLAQAQWDFTAARALYEESLPIRRQLGDQGDVWRALHGLGDIARLTGDAEGARAYYEEELDDHRQAGRRRAFGAPLCCLGYIAWEQGDYALARSRFEEAVAIDREFGHQTGDAGWALGEVALQEGDYERARSICVGLLETARESGNQRIALMALQTYTEVIYARAEAAQDPARGRSEPAPAGAIGPQTATEFVKAARLVGAVEALWQQGSHQGPAELTPGTWQRFVTAARAALAERLGERAVAAAAEGRAMTLEEAIAYALEEATEE